MTPTSGTVRGVMATCNPVGLVTNYFTVPEPVSATYTFNPYR